MRRLTPVAMAIAFAAFLATPALARSSYTQTDSEREWASDAADDDGDDDAGERRHRHRAERRGGRRVAHRGSGTSRACLTGATRALLSRIEAKFGRVQIVSTCRPGAVIAGSGRRSKHASGQAVDFNAPSGRKGEVVRWLIAHHKSGGTMTYRGMSHIHVDIGYHFVALNARGR